ncbi:MAG: phosphoglucosamine mutase [Oscillospiraceae bacterium]|nr:phosphoglucosamine mutase [Oscillospiraceae bacterium]
MRYFGTDGIRGIAGEDLTAELAFKVGNAIGQFIAEELAPSAKTVVVGRDTRISSGMMEAAVTAGICAAGLNTHLLGVAPTPLVSFAITAGHFAAGIMITASHNSYEYNGIKVFGPDGVKLNIIQEQKIESLLKDGGIKNTNCRKIGAIYYDNLMTAKYLKYLRGFVTAVKFKDTTPKIILDCANGGASVTANFIFGGLKNSKIIHNNPNGVNINRNCGAEAINSLRQTLIEEKYDIGFAFDGDADRCLMLNSAGKILDGDNISLILAKLMMQTGRLSIPKIVATQTSNLGFSKAVNNMGLEPVIIADIGDKYVVEEMLKNGYSIGAEHSGHVICADYSRSSDGQLTACLLLKAIAELGLDLHKLGQEFEKVPRIHKTVQCKNNNEIILNETLNDVVKQYETELGSQGRIIVRASGTEPVVRLFVEGPNPQRIAEIADHLVRIVGEVKED